MNVAVLGSGGVGSALAARWRQAGHDVVIGVRDPDKPSARAVRIPGVELLPLPEAAARAEVVVNATPGLASESALGAVGAERLDGKVLLDAALPLDFSHGMPPRLTIALTDSLGERLQRAFPGARVVKSLNTTSYETMVDPDRLPGEHNLFVSGDDDKAKSVVVGLLGDLGWPARRVIDLGGLRTARGTEMYGRLLFDLYGVFGDFDFNLGIHRAGELRQVADGTAEAGQDQHGQASVVS